MAKRKAPLKPLRRKPRTPGLRNPGLPDPKTVVSERTFVSPKGTSFRILRTTEKDPYDREDDDGDNRKD